MDGSPETSIQDEGLNTDLSEQLDLFLHRPKRAPQDQCLLAVGSSICLERTSLVSSLLPARFLGQQL